MESWPYDRKPASPGEILQEEFLTPLGLTQKKCAEHLGVDVKVINRICKGHSAVTPQMALKLSGAFGVSPEFWLNAQAAADLWKLKNSGFKIPELISSRLVGV